MKTLTLLLLLVLAAGSASAATAYEALQVVKQSRGDAVLGQLVEVRGETGQPQPQGWTILMNDPTARGGIREFVVVGKEIASERMPLRGYAGAGKLPALDFARLNLDSDGAFRLANQQAAAAKVGFHTVDYTLRTNDTDGAPMWVLRLFDYMGAPVGNLRVSAQTGKVVRGLQVDPDAREQPIVVRKQAGETVVVTESEPEPTTRFPGGVLGFAERTAKKVGATVKRTTLNTAGTVQEVLTGQRTIGDPEETAGE